MKRRLAASGALVASILPALAAHAAGDPLRGAEICQRCQACHSIERDPVGPRHAGLLGRKAGSVPGFSYSDARRNSGITWSETTLNAFLGGPQAYVPGTFMTFTGLPDPQERADVIAYLKETTKLK